AALRRQGVPHGDPAQRAPGRGPQLRLARPRVRPAGQGRARLSRIRRRADRTRPRNRRSPPRHPPTDSPGRSTPMSKPRPKGLGRGLEVLLGGSDERAARDRDALTALPLADLQPGRYQPRTRMDESSLRDLAASIRTYGVMQPLVVRPVGPGRWE